MISLAARLSLVVGFILSAVEPAHAAQWVYGYVEMVEDYSAYAGGAQGIMITLTGRVWHQVDTGAGNGGTTCPERFDVLAGAQGVDDRMKDRVFSLLLTAATTKRRVGLYVNQDTGPYCQVIIASYGTESR